MKTRLCSRWWNMVLLANLASFSPLAADTHAPPHARWESDIQTFEAADRTNLPPRNATLFVGSSTIRLWKDAPTQFRDHIIINRGFGGSHLSDSVAFADRIVIPYQPRLIVLYAGDNDIAGGKTPERVLADYREFVAKVHATLPQTRIAYLAIKPSPSRAKHQADMKRANDLIASFSTSDDRLLFIDVYTPMLGEDGKPREELFVKDRLHLNEAGYKLWASIVEPVLDKVAP
ncbi:MAG: hypothetical protein KIS67_21235 [Verrucomicrobiae bacterium]|nr:hypothetical protein [Verrucomicrobiae bacterium]